MKVIVVSAHLDDIEWCTGGLVWKLAQDGHKVISVVTNPFYEEWQDDEDKKRNRLREGQSSHALLGSGDPVLLSFHIRQLNITPESKNNFKKRMEGWQPDMVLTHWPLDVHPDHAASFLLVNEYCLTLGTNIELFFFEAHSKSGQPQSLCFYPTHYTDVTGLIEIKKQLIYFHQSQKPDILWATCQEMMTARGKECGVKYSEAFLRATRYGPLHPELAKHLIPTHFKLPQSTGIKVTPAGIGLKL